jgi:hypothetical protein
MKFFSVPADRVEMIERLIVIQRLPLKQRRGLIKGLESEGYTVDFVRDHYRARSATATYEIPERRCPACNKSQVLSAFLTMRDVEHPWCQSCRHADRVGAERARAERDYYASKGDYDIKANEQCGNPECPNGYVIPLRKLRQGAKFCSRQCYEAVVRGPARYCRRPGCGQRLDHDHAEYCNKECRRLALYTKKCGYSQCNTMILERRAHCSEKCRIEAWKESGHFKDMSEKGNESQFDYKAVHGVVPKYEKRRDAVSENNRTNPPRKRKATR